jgi:hypothetical protein
VDTRFPKQAGAISPSSWAIRLLERRVAAVEIIRSGHVNAEAVLLALRVAADTLLGACNERGWSSSAVDELQSKREALGG